MCRFVVCKGVFFVKFASSIGRISFVARQLKVHKMGDGVKCVGGLWKLMHDRLLGITRGKIGW